MDLVQLAARLAELGWAVLFLLLVLVIAVGLYKRWWVPGWVAMSLEKRLGSLETENAAWRRLYLESVTGRGSERDPFGGGPPSAGHL